MADFQPRPRVALLGAREEDIEILAELQRQDQVQLVAVFDPDPHAPGLSLAEISGIPAGSDAAARERLAAAEVIVLPTHRLAYQSAIDWCSGLRAELIGAAEARFRWGGALPAAPTAAEEEEVQTFAARLEALESAGQRLGSPETLGEWLLDTCMHAVGATGGSLQLLARGSSELYVLAARGLGEQVLLHARHALGEPVAGLAAAMRTAQVLHGEQPGKFPSQRGPVSTALCIPLSTPEGTLVGVLNVSSTVPGRRFSAGDLDCLRSAAPRLAALLEGARSRAAAGSAAASRIVAALDGIEEKSRDLGAALTTLAREICLAFDAEAASFLVATESGDWVPLGSAARPQSTILPAPNRALAGRALLEKEWVHASQEEAPETDGVSAMVERAFAVADDPDRVHSWVYAPLLGTGPVGVLCVVFARLAMADAFMTAAPAAVRQLSVVFEARLRLRQMETRLARSTRLARALTALFEAAPRGELEAVLVREAALLVAAERALFRQVDEARRTYSRPIAHGVPESSAEAWRALDAKVTESTLQRRAADVRTAQHGSEHGPEAPPRQRSFVSLPLFLGERLVGVLNVYDKLMQDPLEAGAFTPFDRELLESLGAMAAALLSRRQEQSGEADTPAAPPPSDSAVSPAAPESPAVSPAAPESPATSPPPASPAASTDIDSKRLREELRREVARAQRHQRELGLSLVHLKGLEALAEPARRQVVGQIDRILREYVRSSDLLGWYGPDRLMVVSPEADARGRELEARIRQVLQEKLAAGMQLDLRLGTSSYPRDGDDVAALLQAAVARLA